MNDMYRLKIIHRIVGECLYEYYLAYVGFNHQPKRGEFVVTGKLVGDDDVAHRLGRVVWASKGDDICILQHPDGKLINHGNQFFVAVSISLEIVAQEVFSDIAEIGEDEANKMGCDIVDSREVSAEVEQLREMLEYGQLERSLRELGYELVKITEVPEG